MVSLPHRSWYKERYIELFENVKRNRENEIQYRKLPLENQASRIKICASSQSPLVKTFVNKNKNPKREAKMLPPIASRIKENPNNIEFRSIDGTLNSKIKATILSMKVNARKILIGK